MDKFILKFSYKEILYSRQHGWATARGSNKDASQKLFFERKKANHSMIWEYTV